MKCEFCGGNLHLEELHCPHCGKINAHAQQHIRDMQKYRGEFQEARTNIYTVSKRYGQITVRAIIIVLLLIIFVAGFIVLPQTYSIVRKWEQNKAQRHKGEYMKQIETYIEEEDFLALAYFFQEHYLDYSYDHKDYEIYQPVILAANRYELVYFSVMRLPFAEAEGLEYELKFLGDNIGEFYKYADRDYYDDYYVEFNEDKCGKALDTMNLYVEKLLQVYCNLTQEEAAGLKELSNAKRMVLIEEKMADAK